MKKYLHLLIIFISVFLIYLFVNSNGSFKPKWAIDYFNPLASSLIEGHIDLIDPPMTYDLVHFQGKWYAPWGVLPALLLIPLQIAKGRFVPAFYLSLFFASSNVVLVYLLL